MNGYIEEIRKNDVAKPYGLIRASDGNRYYFNQSCLSNLSFNELKRFDKVEFIPVRSNIGRYDRANNVESRLQTASTPVNPGIHINFIDSHFSDNEKAIINRLKDVLYLTNGGAEFSIARSTYRYCLIKPTEYFKAMFSLNRELVVIFDSYLRFEPRSLDSVKKVYNEIEEKVRIDQSCFLYISRDEQIQAQIHAHLRDINLLQIVIPFTYSELLSAESIDSLVKDRFRQYLFRADLFNLSVPIEDEIFFFGRRDIVNDIVSKCKKGEHCGVFGLRRSGKTSILNLVKKILWQQSYVSVMIPCQSDLCKVDWKGALFLVALNLYQTLGEHMNNSIDDYQTDNTMVYFEQDMLHCLKKFDKTVTIMFDEIEWITFSVAQGEDSSNLWLDGTNFESFWNVIRGFYTKHKGALCILVAGTNPMINEEPTIGDSMMTNPMYGQLSTPSSGAYLQSFTVNDIANMVNSLGGYMGVTFDAYSINKLRDDCGGHPFLIRQLCSHINKYVDAEGMDRPATITKAIYDVSEPAFEKSSEALGFYIMILTILMKSYQKEFEILKELALNGDKNIVRFIDKNELRHLIGYGLVEVNQNHYTINYSSITRYLRGEYKYDRMDLSIEDQKAEIQYRINKAEMQLRDLVKRTLHQAFGKQRAHTRVIQSMRNHPAITQRDTEMAQSLKYGQLFDTSINKMYLSLLSNLILRDFSVFSNLFSPYSRSEVKQRLDRINIARRCPDHSYSEEAENWSQNDFIQFREDMKWLEEILEDIA